jgi:PAS domain-containing protein
MSVPRPMIDEPARAALDAIDHALSITTAVRDRDGKLLDFRLAFVNLAAARWAGLDRSAIIGRMAGQLLPGLRPTGLFAALQRVVETGEPYRRQAARYDDLVVDGRAVSGDYDLGAIRLGDGYLSVWREVRPGDPTSADLEGSLERARKAVRLIRLESAGIRSPRPRFAT